MMFDGRIDDGNSETAGARQTMLAQLRHQLRTPLNVIIGYSEMLLEDAAAAAPGEVIAALREIHESGILLLSLVNETLSPTKIELDLDIERMSGEFRGQMKAPLDRVIGAAESVLERAQGIGSATAVSDLQRIRTAGLKLLALSEDLPNLTRAGAATGHPELRANANAAATPSEVAQLAEAERGFLLVVDDNENNRDILSRYLERRGHDVTAASGGREALAILATRPFDLVLLDIMMPELNGYEILRRLKSDATLSEVPVIFISALDDISGKVRAFRAGCVDYVTKPFQAEEVIARVESQLKISRLQRDLARQNQQLTRKNEELVQAQKRTDLVFTALAEVLPGSVLDEKYRVEERIGKGGFGAVYRGKHLGLDLHVAIKIFRPVAGNDTPEALKQFRLEGVSASRIRHPNAVEILDNGISSTGIAYLVMELLQGHTLAEELREKGALTPRRTAEILAPVCDALAEVHAAGIIHRDIKPENIYLHQSKKGEVVKLLDFGVSKMLGAAAEQTLESMTTTHSFTGTPAYMAPERLANKPYDGRSDVYSLGVILYRMLCGKPPFHSEAGGFVLAMMHLTEEPRSIREHNPDLPAGLDELVRQTLSKDPEKRPTAKRLGELITARANSSSKVAGK